MLRVRRAAWHGVSVLPVMLVCFIWLFQGSFLVSPPGLVKERPCRTSPVCCSCLARTRHAATFLCARVPPCRHGCSCAGPTRYVLFEGGFVSRTLVFPSANHFGCCCQIVALLDKPQAPYLQPIVQRLAKEYAHGCGSFAFI